VILAASLGGLRLSSAHPREYYRLNRRKIACPEDYDLVSLQARMAERFPEDAPEVLFSIMD
jgi:hypothetical protein